MNKDSRIYLAGHTGLVGSAILRKLLSEGYTNIITWSSRDLDLTRQTDVEYFFRYNFIEYVIMCAAKVGGVHANNTLRAEFIRDNLAIQTNVIHSAYESGVKKLLFLGSNCLYPRWVNQPIKEDYLLAGKLEPTTESYAIAKIAGIKMCEAYRHQYGCNFISALPVNLYGPNDNYDLESSHVMPALLSKFHTAKMNNEPYVEIWGSGIPRREFMHVDDLADACLFLMLNYDDPSPINIGTGSDISIEELANTIKEISGYTGELRFNRSRPDGALKKLLDVSRLHEMGWKHKISLKEGIDRVYNEKFGGMNVSDLYKAIEGLEDRSDKDLQAIASIGIDHNYPICCIFEFCKDLARNKKPAKRALDHSGFIPCKSHYNEYKNKVDQLHTLWKKKK